MLVAESSEVESEEEEEESNCACQDGKDSPNIGNRGATPDSKASKEFTKPKPRDDLDMYQAFFPELFDIQVGSN